MPYVVIDHGIEKSCRVLRAQHLTRVESCVLIEHDTIMFRVEHSNLIGGERKDEDHSCMLHFHIITSFAPNFIKMKFCIKHR